MSSIRWVRTFVFFIVFSCLQVTLADWLRIFGIGPDFFLIFVTAVAIKHGPAVGCFWGFVAGFSRDIYSPVEWLGANCIAMTVVGFIVGQLEERFLSLNMPAKVGVLGLGFFACDMIFFFVTGLSKEIVTNLFLTKTMPECLYTMVIGAIVFYLDFGKKKKHA